jgi:hypothetical protein
VPYLLLGVLTLATGLGIGLGLSEAPTEYPSLSSRVISAFNALYRDTYVHSVPIHIEPMAERSEAVSREQAADLVSRSCADGQAKVLAVGRVEAWFNGPEPAPYWAVDFNPPGPHLLLGTEPVHGAPRHANWFLGFIGAKRVTQPFCAFGHFSGLAPLPVFSGSPPLFFH